MGVKSLYDFLDGLTRVGTSNLLIIHSNRVPPLLKALVFGRVVYSLRKFFNHRECAVQMSKIGLILDVLLDGYYDERDGFEAGNDNLVNRGFNIAFTSLTI